MIKAVTFSVFPGCPKFATQDFEEVLQQGMHQKQVAIAQNILASKLDVGLIAQVARPQQRGYHEAQKPQHRHPPQSMPL